MSDQRHNDNRLVEIDALEQLRQIKEDTVTMIMNVREATRNRETPKSRGSRGGTFWMMTVAMVCSGLLAGIIWLGPELQANEIGVINADE